VSNTLFIMFNKCVSVRNVLWLWWGAFASLTSKILAAYVANKFYFMVEQQHSPSSKARMDC